MGPAARTPGKTGEEPRRSAGPDDGSAAFWLLLPRLAKGLPSGRKVSKRRHRKWTIREINTSTFPLFALRSSLFALRSSLFALRSSLFAFKRGHQQQGQHSFSKVALNHLSALTAGHFLSNATKSNQKTLAPIIRPLRCAPGSPRYGPAPGSTRCRPHPWGLSA